MTFRKGTIAAVVSTATLAFAAGLNASQASTLVATVYGVYDASSCGSDGSCLSPPAGQPLAPTLSSNGADTYDTPSLFINNNTAYSFTNVQIQLTGYQGINNGSVTDVPSNQINGGTIAAETLYLLTWTGGTYGNPVPPGGSNTSANLFAYDYDDYYYTGQLLNPACDPQGATYCSQVGNFSVLLTATWNNPAYGPSGTPIYALFSPTTNLQGSFVGWEGVDPNGWSESNYDNHTGSEAGVLADIYVGTPPSGVPEPSTWAMMLLGFAGLGFASYRASRKSGALAA